MGVPEGAGWEGRHTVHSAPPDAARLQSMADKHTARHVISALHIPSLIHNYNNVVKTKQTISVRT